jgi:hypothetical protein
MSYRRKRVIDKIIYMNRLLKGWAMKKQSIAIALSATLAFTPMLCACGGNQSSGSQSASQATEAVEDKHTAPVLDGKWRQVGHTADEDGMIGTIDEDMIALWIKAGDNDWTYWCGSFEAPKDDGAYSWTSKAEKGYMTGLLASQDDKKDFSYADGKITFQFSMRGETTTIEMEQVSEETGLLAELRSGEGKPVDKEESKVKDLVLADSCYTISDGYVSFVIAVNNPNKDYAPQSVNVSVVGRSDDGKITFSDDWGTGTTLPGATTYWTSRVGNGNASDSDTIEIKVSVDDDDWYKTSERYDFYQIDNVSTSEDSFGSPIVTGEITLKRDVELKGFGEADSPQYVCVLRDSDGKMVGGFSSYAKKDLKVGEATPFEVSPLGQYKVDFATAEVYANPWM